MLEEIFKKIEFIHFSKKESNWEEVKNKTQHLSDWGIRILSEGLDDFTKTVVVEYPYICKDHRNLYSNFYSKKFKISSPYTSRLHFFSENISKETFLNDFDMCQNSYIGYSIIRPIPERCIGRTIIDPCKINKFIEQGIFCLRTRFKVHLFGKELFVLGYPYTSQDRDATLCAHASLWGVCRYLSERYNIYREMYPYDLIKLTGETSGRIVPYRGMTYSDYSKILSNFGTYPIIMRTKAHPGKSEINEEELKNLYSYVESGFPVLASYSGHVIAIIGHTIDYNKKDITPKDGIIYSSDYLSQLVVVDDNCFPYALLGYNDDENNYGNSFAQKYNIHSIYSFVCPLPEKAFLPVERARNKIFNYIIELRSEKSLDFNDRNPVILRILLTSSMSFVKKKVEIGQNETDGLSYLVSKLNLPHFIWVCEVYNLDSYKEGKCIAEIILDATSGENDSSIIYKRINNKMMIQKKIYKSKSHQFSQYRHNLGE